MKLPITLKLRLEMLKIALLPGLSPTTIGRVINRHGGINYNDVQADETPFDFVTKLGVGVAIPTLTFLEGIASPESFTPPSLPAFYNSEPSVARFLSQLICLRQPRVVAEIGCFVGWTSVHMALALQAQPLPGQLYCVDMLAPALAATRDNLQRHQITAGVTTLLGGSLDAAVMAQLPDLIDLVFIDSSHRYPDTLLEIQAYAPRLTQEGCMVLHDSISFAGVRQSLAEASSGFHVHTFATEQGNGLTVLTRRQP